MENFSSLHNICYQIFQEVSKTTSIFILPLFIGRLAFSGVVGQGSQALTTIKSAVIYFCLIAGFPLILDILFSIPEGFLPRMDSFAQGVGEVPALGEATVIPFGLDVIIEVLLAGIYWLVYYLHIFFMLVMCSMAPIVFLTSTFLGVGLGLEIFLGLLIIGSSWPIIWFGFDQVHDALVTAQTDSFGAKCLELLLTLFKGLAPVAFASIAIKSPAGQMISKAAQATISGGKFSVATAVSLKSVGSRGSSFQNAAQMMNRPQGKGRTWSLPSHNLSQDRLEKAKSQKPKTQEVDK